MFSSKDTVESLREMNTKAVYDLALTTLLFIEETTEGLPHNAFKSAREELRDLIGVELEKEIKKEIDDKPPWE